MQITAIAGAALLCVILILTLRELRASLALPARLAATLMLVGAALALLAPILLRVRELFALAGEPEYATVILRATGIALICELVATFCRDLGEGTVAEGVLLFGKLEILVLCLPLMDAVLDVAKELLQF